MTALPRFNLANKITLARFLLAILLFVLLFLIQEGRIPWRRTAAWIALLLFLLAAVSDILDGYLARSRNMVTAFGRIADPFVDKVIVCGTFIFLSAIHDLALFVSPWVVVVIVMREFLVNGIRSYLESRGIDFSAATMGKAKMVIQCVTIAALLLHVGLESPPWFAAVCRVSVYATLLITVVSGLSYARRAVQLLRGAEI